MVQPPIPNWLFFSFGLFASLALLCKASDYAVYGISRYAKRLGASDYLIGLFVVGIASSTPELVAAYSGARLGQGGIVMGTILGSNIAELTLVLGLITTVGGQLRMKSRTAQKTKWYLLAANLLPFALLFDGVLSRLDGVLLILAYLGFLALSWNKESKVGKIKKQVPFKLIWRDALIWLLAFVTIVLTSRYLVVSSLHLSAAAGLSPFFIALVIIGNGSSVSDITVGIRAVQKRHEGVGIGNIIGSNTLKSTLVLGIIALARPIAFPFSGIAVVLIASLIAFGLLGWCLKDRRISLREGLVLMAIYGGCLVVEALRGAF